MIGPNGAKDLGRQISRLVIAICVVKMAIGCGQKSQKCGDPSKVALEQCQTNGDKLQREILDLKRQLAQALANPGTIKIDPSVLTINGKHVAPKVMEGNLSQQEVVSTIRRNKKVLKSCYERAMKKNGSLRHQKITLSLAFKIKPSGIPMGISVRPNYDGRMIDCMQKAIRRWKFPSFSGQPVGVESPLTLTPKN